jgi:hypothetical protein
MLDVKVETINGRSSASIVGIKRTGAIPVLVIRTKGTPEEVGKVDALLVSRHLIVATVLVIDTTDAKENLDTTLLAVRDALLDRVALAQEVSSDVVLVLVGSSPAVSGEVGTGVTRVGVLRGLVNERQCHILGTIITVALQGLVSELSLSMSVTNFMFQ